MHFTHDFAIKAVADLKPQLMGYETHLKSLILHQVYLVKHYHK